MRYRAGTGHPGRCLWPAACVPKVRRALHSDEPLGIRRPRLIPLHEGVLLGPNLRAMHHSRSLPPRPHSPSRQVSRAFLLGRLHTSRLTDAAGFYDGSTSIVMWESYLRSVAKLLMSLPSADLFAERFRSLGRLILMIRMYSSRSLSTAGANGGVTSTP